jgi:ectoine hydroxylase-related dioxygenase (phytanoyl-CoA dioxygenase family)
MLGERHRRELDELGYTVFEGFMTPEFHRALADRIEALFEAEGENAGAEFKREEGARRLANLASKGRIFLDVIVEPRLLAAIGHVLGPKFKLSSLNARSANPNSDSSQPLHVDMAALPDEQGPWVCNSVWLIDEFTTENGALRVIPGSHRWGKRPQEVLADPAAPHPEEVLVTGPARTVVVMNAHLWHSGTANRTARPRTALHAFYCRRDKPQQQYQKELLAPELQAALSPKLREILALDDPLNDELSSKPRVTSGFLK